MQVTLTFFTHATGWHKPLPDIDSPRTLVLVFSDPDPQHYQQALDTLQKKYANSIIAGCSTVAGIFNEHLLENALVVGVIHFHNSLLALTSAELHTPEDSLMAGKKIANDLNAPDLKGILILSDGLNTLGNELIKGIASVINQREVTLVGGLASDKMQFAKTWVWLHGQALTHRALGIGFYGEKLVFASHAQDGFKPFGPERQITRAANNILYEIDGQPALELYKEYLGEHANGLPATALHFPLAIWNEDKEHYVVRTIIAIDETENSLKFIADIPVGYRTQLMYGSFDNLLDGAELAARNLTKKLPPINPYWR